MKVCVNAVIRMQVRIILRITVIGCNSVGIAKL